MYSVQQQWTEYNLSAAAVCVAVSWLLAMLQFAPQNKADLDL